MRGEELRSYWLRLIVGYGFPARGWRAGRRNAGAAAGSHVSDDFLLPPVGPTRVMEDNNQVVLAVTRPVPTRATRHVVVRYCYVQDLAQAGEIVVIYCSTVAQLADVLTKLVGRVIFLRLRTVVLGYGSWAELCVSVEGGGVLPRTNRATPHAESS